MERFPSGIAGSGAPVPRAKGVSWRETQDAMLRQYQREIAALRAELAAPHGAPHSGDHDAGGWRCSSVDLAALDEPVSLSGGAGLADQVASSCFMFILVSIISRPLLPSGVSVRRNESPAALPRRDHLHKKMHS